ncbi:MAG: DUF951 domain-containing protein [Bacillota bacterium]
MNKDKLKKGSILVLKKGHPCGENLWEIIRFGAVCKLKCLGCQREVLMNRMDLRKKVKKVVNNEEDN